MVVDDLVGWLIGLLAQAARKRLISLVIGSDLERALWAVTEMAIAGTAADLLPGGGAPAEALARVIDQVVRARVPRELDLTREGTLTQWIASGMAAQLAVLDDALLTGQEMSSAEVLGISARDIADRLTQRLTSGIRGAGLSGGPLKPWADQLNFDLTQAQGKAILDRLGVHASAVPTAEEFAADVRALLNGLLGQAEHGRLPSYLRGRADVLGVTRPVLVRAGVREHGVLSWSSQDRTASPYPLAADRPDQLRPPVPWREVADANDRVIVLADPGLGKSWLVRTETRRLVIAALARAAEGLAGVVVPVPLRCDQLAAADGADLPSRAASFLIGQGLLAVRSRELMAELIRAGGAVILLDAMDELTAGEAGVVRALVSSWADQSKQRARCVITSRVAGYTGSPLPDAAEVELQAFTADDVAAVIRAWRLSAAAEQELLGWVGDPGVASMARMPLLLALLCALAAAQPNGAALPTTRGELYERVLRWFLTGAHRSEDDRATPPLTDVRVEALLDLLGPIAFAFATRPGGWVDLMPAADLLNAIRAAGPTFTELGLSAADVLIELSAGAGIFVPDRDPSAGRPARYLFLHRNFAEYLVARHLAALPATDWLSVISEHQWFDPDWWPVIVMLGGQLSREAARQLIAHLLGPDPDPFWHALLTAIAVAGERQDIDLVLTPEQSARMAQSVSSLMHHDVGRQLTAESMMRMTHLASATRAALLACLESPDGRVRGAAATALTGQAGQDVTAGLLACLGSPEAYVRAAAVRALAGREGQEVTAGLLARLDDSDLYVRLPAMEALAGREGQEITSELLSFFGETEKVTRVVAAKAMAGRSGHDVTARLLEHLVSHDGYTSGTAARALTARDGYDVTAVLLARLHDHDGYVRMTAIEALTGRAGQDVTAGLLARLDDLVWGVRDAAALGLRGRQGQDVTAGLLALVGDPEARVRQAAAAALAGRKGQDVTAGLLLLLDDPHKWVSVQAAKALAGREGQDVTTGLLRRLADADMYVSAAAAEALAGREGQDVTTGLLARLTDPDDWISRAAAQALAGREGQEITTRLLARLNNPDRNARSVAVQALAEREGRSITTSLLAFLDSDDGGMRWAAGKVLARRKGQDIATVLLARLDNPDPDIRSAAVRALVGREGQDVTAGLLAALDDDERYVRDAAVWALAGLDGRDVTAGLLARLDDSEEDIRKAAAQVLAHRESAADLLVLARHSWPEYVPPATLTSAYELTRRHYRALPSADQEMVRTRMHHLTLASY